MGGEVTPCTTTGCCKLAVSIHNVSPTLISPLRILIIPLTTSVDDSRRIVNYEGRLAQGVLVASGTCAMIYARIV
eukprot:5442813-Pyramimonas_sp.AAC.3